MVYSKHVCKFAKQELTLQSMIGQFDFTFCIFYYKTIFLI